MGEGTFPLNELSDLREAPYNPRSITKEAIAALRNSISEFGYISGIVYNELSGHLVAGHQRLKALKQQYGEKLVLEGTVLKTPDEREFLVRVVSWDETTEKAANLAANSDLIQGEFTDGLKSIVDELTEQIPDMMDALRLDELVEDATPKGSVKNLKLNKPEKKVWVLVGIPAETFEKYADMFAEIEKEEQVSYDYAIK